jgi:hypothetical protein
MAVGVNLEGERSPRLQTDVDQTQLRIEEIVVENALLPGPGKEAGPFVTWNQLERVAGFLGAKNADETVFDALLAQ